MMHTNSTLRYAALGLALAGAFAAASPLLAAPPKATRTHKGKKAGLPPMRVQPAAPVASTDAAAVPGETYLYNGQTLDQSGITATAWGGGAAADSTEVAYSNSHSIKVTTEGLYQGATLTFNTPADLSAGATGGTRYLQMTLRFQAPVAPSGSPGGFPGGFPGGGGGFPGGFPGGGGGFPGGGRGGFPGGAGGKGGGEGQLPGKGGGNPLLTSGSGSGLTHSGVFTGGASAQLAQGRRGGGGFPGGGGGFPGGYPGQGNPGQGGYGQNTGPFIPDHLRMVFTLANGAQADILRAVPSPNEAEGGSGGETWVTIGVPVSALKFAGGASSPLKSITVGGDNYAVFYLGQVALLDDSAPISNVFAGDTQDVAAADVITLHGVATGGAASLKYSWNFDSANGGGEQATGQNVTTQYFKGGKDYTVTLTVSDVDGIKKPVSATTIVHVNE